MAVAGLAAAFGWLGAGALIEAYLVAAALMAAGLFFVFLEIGRKLRFLYVLLRPQSSWMTRETYAVAAIYPALAADVLWPHPVLHAIVALAGGRLSLLPGEDPFRRQGDTGLARAPYPLADRGQRSVGGRRASSRS